MERSPAKLLRRLAVTILVMFFVGFLIFYFKDRFTGSAILVGGGLALVMGLIMYYKLKRNDPEGAARVLPTFYILGGVTILILSLIVVILGGDFGAFLYGIPGLMLLAYGIRLYISKSS